MSNKEREKYRSEEYFSGSEVAVAEAIYYGETKQLEKLINQGTAISHIGKAGFTYLLYAIMIENYEITEFLLKKGADPNQLSPLMKTKRNAMREEKDWRPLNMLPLETCCGASYPIKYMKLLVKYGADLNDNRTTTPMRAAIISDNMEKIKYLVASKANINQPSQSSTPLMTAAKVMSWDVIDYLLDCGADVFHVDEDGYTLGLYLQEYIHRDVWTPTGRKRLEGLINRLKEKGVKFPVIKQTPTPLAPVSRVDKPSPPLSSPPTSQEKGTPPSRPHSWILDDDDDWIIS